MTTSANTWICPFSTSTIRSWRRMNRRGTAADIRRILKKARDMGFTLRTSLIVGFPGETEEQFQELMDFVAEARFDRMGAFAFSPEEKHPRRGNARPNPRGGQAGAPGPPDETAGADFPGKQPGAHRHGGKGAGGHRRPGRLFLGRSQREAPDADGAIVFTAREAPEVGSFVQVRVTGAETYDLKGERL